MNLVVFDIDGTLTNSERQHQTAYVETMKSFGISNINTNWKSYTHHTDSYILNENYKVNFNNDFDLSFLMEFEVKMTEVMGSLDPIEQISGAQKLLNYLRQKNYAIAFATGSIKAPALLKLQQAQLWHDEALIATANNHFTREAIVNDAIAKAKSYYQAETFDEIISVGDGLWDLQTARNLNLHFIGVGLKHDAVFKKENIPVYTRDWKNFNFEVALELLIK